MDEQAVVEAKRFERIFGKDIRVGTAEQFSQEVLGMKMEPGKAPLRLVLGIEKFKLSGPGDKLYRLTWSAAGVKSAWLAAENTTPYRTKARIEAAGELLAAETGAYFDTVTR